jgi:ankyrin repeat protein
MLVARPDIERDPWVGLVLGRGWDGDPAKPGGPRGWAPVLYAAHSAFAPVGVLRDLLARGADPNASFVNEFGRMSALYGAAGVVHDVEMTRVLLEAGADPDDGESVYHAAAADDPACLRTLLEHGAQAAGTNALGVALDEERPEHVRLLLEHGVDVEEAAFVAHAVRRGRSPAVIELLAAHGADVNRPGGETWRGDVPLRTPYSHAVLRNRTDVAEALARLGASTVVSADDEAVAAVARGEHPPAALPVELDPDPQEVLILAALRGQLRAVVDAVGVDFRGVVGGSPPGTLLHHAAWIGDPALVEELIDRGADPCAGSGTEMSTPLAWAARASEYWRLPGRDYVAVAERLHEAGCPLERRVLDRADGPLYEWIDARVG